MHAGGGGGGGGSLRYSSSKKRKETRVEAASPSQLTSMSDFTGMSNFRMCAVNFDEVLDIFKQKNRRIRL